MGFSVTNKPPSICRHMCAEVNGEHARVLSYVKLRTPHINVFLWIQIDVGHVLWNFFSLKKMHLQFLRARITCRELAKGTGDSPPQAKQPLSCQHLQKSKKVSLFWLIYSQSLLITVRYDTYLQDLGINASAINAWEVHSHLSLPPQAQFLYKFSRPPRNHLSLSFHNCLLYSVVIS